MAEFFDMGGFGNYIWSSYGFAVICLGWLNYASWRKAQTPQNSLPFYKLARLQAQRTQNKNIRNKNS